MGLFDRLKNAIVIIMIVAMSLCITSCSYNPPEGYTKEHHTYEDMVEYAKSIDSKATVEETSSVVKDEYDIEYIVWDAVIRGVNCRVASIPQNVYNDGFLAGEFASTFYRMDTDYDYSVMQKIIADKYPTWNLIDEEGHRFHPNNFLLVEKNIGEYRMLSDDELEQVLVEAQSINKEYEAVSLNKQASFRVPAPGEFWNHHGEQKSFVRKKSSVGIRGFSEDEKQEFFENYKEGWALLDSGLPVYE